MLKWIFLLIVAYFLFKVLFGRKKTSSHKKVSYRDTEMLVSCPRCGAFFQTEQGVMSGGKVYCGTDCLKGE